MTRTNRFIGFACAYTPLALIHAAGFTPHRILPLEDCPDGSGRILHDNLCPHVKGILDRAMDQRLPDLAGMVLMNSCDAMRRLFDGWKTVRPDIPAVLLDLPMAVNSRAVDLFRDEIRNLSALLDSWGGSSPDEGRIKSSIGLYNTLTRRLADLRDAVRKGDAENPSALIQAVCNKASSEPPETVLEHLETLFRSGPERPHRPHVPVFLFGNMLPAPDAFTLFESCGAFIAGDDLCTGSRLFSEMGAGDDVWTEIGRASCRERVS
jgi:benzoyl-CoA reductase/2-hydroxyglutaryl-CoA dehydratase subunit BcrC/BadD/HgdB